MKNYGTLSIYSWELKSVFVTKKLIHIILGKKYIILWNIQYLYEILWVILKNISNILIIKKRNHIIIIWK